MSRVRGLTRCVVESMNDPSTAPMEIDARLGHLSMDWSKSKGKDSKGKGGKKGKQGEDQQRRLPEVRTTGPWAKNCPNPAKAIHGLDGQSDADNGLWQWSGDGHEWAAPAEQSPAESQRGAPQPIAEPGGLWLASLTAVVESEHKRETSPAAELMSLEGRAAERIMFGVDSGAALTVISKDVAAKHPGVQGHTRPMTDCQGNPVVNLGQKRPGLQGADRQEFCKSDRGVSGQELAVGELLVEDWSLSAPRPFQAILAEGIATAREDGQPSTAKEP